jgi:hypothetical protein
MTTLRLAVSLLWVLLAAALGVPLASAAAPEPPALAARVAAGALPPLAQRLPEHPLVVVTDPEAVYGGELRTLIGTPKDTKLLSVYGYARLVRFDRNYQLGPDLLESFEVQEGRIFTLHLRRGHRRSPRPARRRASSSTVSPPSSRSSTPGRSATAGRSRTTSSCWIRPGPSRRPCTGPPTT